MTIHQDEDMVRRALADEALGYRPPHWAGPAAAIHERGARRRVRRAFAAAVAVAAVGVALAVTSGGAQAGRVVAASAVSQASSTSARPSASASVAAVPWPAVRVVPADRDLDFGHQIWMRLTAAEACEALGPYATRAYSCNTITDGNQPQGSVSAREAADSSGTLYAPLYLGPGDAARMTAAVHGRTYRATVVTLAGHPGYATGFLWLPTGPQPPEHGSEIQITVYDAQGMVLAEAEVPGM
ncbi:hypothetical protein ABH940_006461 [Streptacidiphilus sp. BW17]|uniref:hypothetical protein n=1 Tax=Streptacidiphilus sp. BW17 TaxID=3156274 RepID=UPI0035156C16